MSRPVLDVACLDGLPDRPAADAIEAVDALGTALLAASDPDALQAVARALPRTVAALTPEVALAVQRIATALVAHRPRLPRDLGRLEPWLRSRWLRVGLATADETAREIEEPMLRAALDGWSLDPVLEVEPLLRRMVGARDPWLRERALRELPGAVEGLALTRARALDVLAPLATDEDPAIRARAIEGLREAWLQGLPPAEARRRDALVQAAMSDAEPTVVARAVEVAVVLGRREWLLTRLHDPRVPAASRAAILAALGPLARDEDLDPVLQLATAEPLRFAGPARTFLLEGHRHGVFPKEHHLAALLSSFDQHPAWTGEELVRVTHVVRHALVEQIARLEPDDRRWIRRAEILAVSVSPEAPSVLARGLASTDDPAVAAALVEAAGRCAAYEGEAPLLRWLDRLPEVVVPVLQVKGGEASRPRLQALVEDPVVSPVLRRQAMGALWALTDERDALLRALSARLGPHDSGLLDGAHRVLRDRRIAAIVVDAPWSDEPAHAIDPMRRLEVMCESGDRALMPRVEALFREIYRGYVRRALAGDFTIKRVAMPSLEQQVFRYGRHLVAEGWSVRRTTGPGPQTGRDLVLRLSCDWLEEEPASSVMVALLETIARQRPTGWVLRRIEPLWRHGHGEVRRAAIEALLAAGDGARGLEPSIARLVEHDEPRIVVQALAGVGMLEATWAEPMVLRALRRPPMGVKKAAAEALIRIATPAAVPAVVEWLAHHDNAAFRRSLTGALRRAAGSSYGAVLVDAVERETDPRRVRLLHDALDGALPLRAAVRLARSEHPAHRRLLEACLDGSVRLRDGDRDALAARLHRARLEPEPPRRDPGRRLRVEGFSVEAAAELVKARAPECEAEVLATVRPALAEWIAWLSAEPEPDPDALGLVFDAAQARHGELVDGLLALAERAGAAVEAGAVGLFVERCVALAERPRPPKIRALAWLRAAPSSSRLDGLRRWRLLERLDAVRGREDLWRCLEDCRVGPHGAKRTVELLGEALRVPPKAPDEPAARAELREQIERFGGLSEDERRAWLESILERRPLELSVVVEPAPPARPRFVPASAEDRRALLAALVGDDEQERGRAAALLLQWPDARDVWSTVLAAYLDGRVELTPEHRARVAPQLTAWPTEEDAARRATALLPWCAPWRYRSFVREWIEAWDAGEAWAEDRLREAPEAWLMPWVRERAAGGDGRLARLLAPSGSLAVRTIVGMLQPTSPDDVAHLQPREPATELDDAEDPVDPLAGKGPDDLVSLIETKGVAKGLAVRAVHALAALGERAEAPLVRLVVDRRPAVRSAALRALRRVAPREVSLAAAARVLAMETRRDVVLQLMKSLGHGRHEPSLSALVERLEHRDVRVRQGAHDAIMAWGAAVLPALRRATRKARPDRRPTLQQLIAELERADDE